MSGKKLKSVIRTLCATACFFSCASAAFAAGTTGNVCERHLLVASKSEGVPVEVLYAVGLTESGNKGRMHPFALNIEGETVFANGKADALNKFAEARKQGRKLIDLGCMQINHYYHGSQFSGPDDMLVPEKNVAYAAKFLKRLHQEHGSWTMAVARYHASAGNKKAQKRYICNVIRNVVSTGFGQWTPEAKSFCDVK